MPNHTPALCSLATLAFVGASLLVQAQTNQALARCENRPGATIAECRLTVLGR